MQELGGKMCRALPALHAITGCDSTSALAGIGKKKGWQVLLRNEQHQDSLGLLGSQRNLSDDIATQCEAFICDLYPRSRMNLRTVDELRYFLFCQNRKQKNELLPPTSDSLLQHLKRVNYQTFVWRKALTAIQHLPKPESNGWVRENSSLKPVYMTKEPAPSSLLELTTCTCQSGCQSNCSCNNTGLSCSEACYCMASSDMCRNPHGVLLDFVSDSASEDSSSECRFQFPFDT
ncbi:uncharacterized protein LOC122948313 [Acropora millepora]|uniref:uncharacterized protein LOC122948313 n=1 Tax=Acropora millepora TaxID=45264 RepID=UPI001CF5C86B|nr:uncharacterized protein LOC122948313 [Acropora millepora]